MNKARLNEIKRLLAARDWRLDLQACANASPAPWLPGVTDPFEQEAMVMQWPVGGCLRVWRRMPSRASVWGEPVPYEAHFVGREDEPFIAASREGWPAATEAAPAAAELLAEVVRLRAEVRRLKGARGK